MAPPSAPLSPSGHQVVIRHGDQLLTVVEVGGGIRCFTVGDEDVIDPYPASEMCPSARGQLLIPWPNRLADGCYQVDGQMFEIPQNEADRHNAIHGLSRFVNWRVAEQGSARALMAHRLHPQPGYPFLLDLHVEYRLDDTGLTVTMSATNQGDRRCPYGAGAHPYLRMGADSGRVDDWTLGVPGGTRLESDERDIPLRHSPVAGTPFDFRRPRCIGSTRLNTAYTDLQRGPGGRAVVGLTDASGRRQLQLWVDEAFSFLMVFTGDTLPAGRQRQGLAVEPMTCAPNAFRSGDGVQMLEPGQTTTAAWGITTTAFMG